MSALLAAEGLRKVYRRAQDDLLVLAACDLALAEGEAVAVIGPSGAGKSTLLNLLGGLDRPSGGRLLYRDRELPGRECRELAAWRNRCLGFVFQFHFLLPDFTALENLLIPVRMSGQVNGAAEERARHLLEALGLSEREDHLPGELSGGEQQRVAVARAFMNRPEIVLADEPFGNLDREKSRQLGELLFELRSREGTALVIVTHDLSLAKRADRIYRLEDGCLHAA